MYTDLICPECGELLPVIKKTIKIDSSLPVADKYFCNRCDITWHLFMLSRSNPLILNLEKINPQILVSEVRKAISKQKEW